VIGYWGGRSKRTSNIERPTLNIEGEEVEEDIEHRTLNIEVEEFAEATS
jgi:hypothetical protein